MSISLITNPKIEDEVKIMIPTDGGLVDINEIVDDDFVNLIRKVNKLVN